MFDTKATKGRGVYLREKFKFSELLSPLLPSTFLYHYGNNHANEKNLLKLNVHTENGVFILRCQVTPFNKYQKLKVYSQYILSAYV